MKLVGTEGAFDQLLTRVRFEEAKLRDLGYQPFKGSSSKPFFSRPTGRGDKNSDPTHRPDGEQSRKPAPRCFNYGQGISIGIACSH